MNPCLSICIESQNHSSLPAKTTLYPSSVMRAGFLIFESRSGYLSVQSILWDWADYRALQNLISCFLHTPPLPLAHSLHCPLSFSFPLFGDLCTFYDKDCKKQNLTEASSSRVSVFCCKPPRFPLNGSTPGKALNLGPRKTSVIWEVVSVQIFF